MKFSMNQSRGTFTVVAVLSAIMLSSCMKAETKPVNSMTQAQTVVDQADRAGTRNYAAFDLNNAQSKLKKAEEEMKMGKYKEARYLAKEAKVDAELALAKTQTAKRKEAETQLKQSMQSLQNETEKQGNSAQ
ncbi:MAG: DUF4398 domain-containing protein [Leptospirales bacterium]